MTQPLLAAFARNNAWSNHRLLGACAKLSQADFHAKRTSFFPTIARTLNHILVVDWYYIDALAAEGRGRSVFDNEEPFSELAPLRAAQRESDMKLIALVDALTDPGREVRLARRTHMQVERADQMLMHLFTHQIHHRGQVHAMLSGTHVPPPQLDDFFLTDDLALRQAELDELGIS